jgi:hypothetical protein
MALGEKRVPAAMIIPTAVNAGAIIQSMHSKKIGKLRRYRADRCLLIYFKHYRYTNFK